MRNQLLTLAAAFVFCCTGSAQTGTITRSKVISDSVGLLTRLVLPERPMKKKPPVLIIVHGSGNKGNWNTYFPMISRFAEQGIAMVFFEKRGTGGSGGIYGEVSPNTSTAIFEQLSRDVAAVASWTKKQARIDTARIGLLAYSEGGWVAPLALSKSEDLKFSVILSGPICSVGQEFLFTELTDSEGEGIEISKDSLYAKMKAFEGEASFDSSPYVEDMVVPGLWLFGEKDRSMAVDFSRMRLTEIMAAYPEKPLFYKVYPNANHSLYDTESKKRMPYAVDVRNWLLRHLYQD